MGIGGNHIRLGRLGSYCKSFHLVLFFAISITFRTNSLSFLKVSAFHGISQMSNPMVPIPTLLWSFSESQIISLFSSTVLAISDPLIESTSMKTADRPLLIQISSLDDSKPNLVIFAINNILFSLSSPDHLHLLVPFKKYSTFF